MVNNDRDDIPEDTTVTRGVVVIAVEVDSRHNEVQERYKMKHNGHPMDVLTDTKSLTDVLKPPPPTYGMSLSTCTKPRTYRHAREHINVWGVLDT